MNQERIGKFIAKERKAKNLTQEQLAEMLGVSKNAVSKWERGICLMDMSLLKPLCDILEITINELLSGEKVKKEEYQEKFEENIINTIEYTNKKINKKDNIIKILVTTFIIIISLIIITFTIDINRMINNKPIFFSTWGTDYAPPINLDEEKLNKAIEDYLLTNEYSGNKYHDNMHSFVSMKTYLIQELDNNITIVYAWALVKTYYQENNEIIKDSASSIPYKFTLEKEEDDYLVLTHQIPRDGSYYEEDMKKIFPKYVLRKMNKVHQDGTIEKLSFDIDKQKENYYRK